MLEYFIHLDVHLHNLLAACGWWTYAILFSVVFCETGLVVTPFLPGDSLLFAAGMLSAGGLLDHWLLMLLLCAAAILGDSVNYHIGYLVGQRAFSLNNRFIKQKHLQAAQQFYERHGGKTIVLARFIPLMRTFAPFVAGIARMDYRRFLFFNVSGAIVWVCVFVQAGRLFGHLPLIKNNFSIAILAIIIISLLPAAIEFGRAYLAGRKLGTQ